MILKIATFVFNLNDTDIDSIQHQLSFGWNRQQRVGNHQHTQRDGLWSESINFAGKLVMKSVSSLNDFEEIAKKQLPVRITFGTGESYQVTIDSLSRTKSGFLKDGKYRYQEYSISLQRYFK